MLKSILFILVLAVACGSAYADDVSIAFDSSNTLIGIAGTSIPIVVSATLTDLDAVGIDLTAGSINFTAQFVASDTAPAIDTYDYSLGWPLSLDANPLPGDTATFQMFSVDLSGAAPGDYVWTFIVYGDLMPDPGGPTGGDSLTSGTFTVDVEAPVAPEPGSLGLTGIGLAVAAALQRRRLAAAFLRPKT